MLAINLCGCTEMFALSDDETILTLYFCCSYSIMQSCWESEPEKRPQFCELVSTISGTLESAAGCVELAMSLKTDHNNCKGERSELMMANL